MGKKPTILVIFPKHCFFTLRICGLTDDVHLRKSLPCTLAAVGLLTGFLKTRLTPLLLGRYCRQTQTRRLNRILISVKFY